MSKFNEPVIPAGNSVYIPEIEDEMDVMMAVVADDDEFYGSDKVLKESADNGEDFIDDDVEDTEYDSDLDDATDPDDIAAQDLRKTRDSGWELNIDDDVEDVMMDDEIDDDGEIEFGDDWPDDADCCSNEEEV